MLSLAQVAEATGGELVGSGTGPLTSVSTDTRKIDSGALFVALIGPSFNGHDFLSQAVERGAEAFLVSDVDALPEGVSAVVVDDTLDGLQRLAAWHRRRMPALVLGLTGSVGKTTTKELTAAILSQVGPTLATEGNLNNHIGVPLTLLRMRRSHRFAVIEMGCNDFGEIDLLARMAAPTIGLVTAVAEAHLEKLGDLEGVARAKGELLAALPPEGTAVINLDDSRVREMASPATRRLGYGSDSNADVSLVAREMDEVSQRLQLRTPLGELEPKLRLLGEHNGCNATAAVALALAAGAFQEKGLEPASVGLEQVEAPAGRLRLCQTDGGLRVIDDTYNANPKSVEAALGAALEFRGDSGAWLLMGEMAELGDGAEAAHRDVGAMAARAGVTGLIGVGPVADLYRVGALEGGMNPANVMTVDSPEEAAEQALSRAASGDVVLVKGSRVARMERAVAALRGE